MFISELKISGKGKTLDEAYKNLLDKKEDIVREFEELGILCDLVITVTSRLGSCLVIINLGY